MSDNEFLNTSTDEEEEIKNQKSSFGGEGQTRVSVLWVVIRYPLLFLILSSILTDALIYFAVRLAVSLYESLFVWVGELRFLKTSLDSVECYSQYELIAKKIDVFMDNDQWKLGRRNPVYDECLIKKIRRRLARLRLSMPSFEFDTSGSFDSSTTAINYTQKVNDMMQILLHGGCKANVGNLDSEELYSHSFIGTTSTITSYFIEIEKSLNYLSQTEFIDDKTRSEFFKKTSKLYGRTSLCLSGGATIAYYHVGVAKALFESNLLPQVITGTSGGALIAAMLCVRNDEEIVREVFTPEVYKSLNACEGTTIFGKLFTFMRRGYIFDFDVWYTKVCKTITMGEMTFLEAYKKTGRILNLSVVPDEPYSTSKLLNYITSPDVVIASAVIASSCLPGLLEPVTLLMKTATGQIQPYLGAGNKWRDGSLHTDIPEKELHQLFDVNYTIVSQTNPHVLLFFYNRTGSAGNPVPHRQGKGWRGGFVASALTQHFKLDMQKWLYLLRDLSLLPRFLGVDVSYVFTQNFVGTATVTPGIKFTDFFNIMSDPTFERMAGYIRGGEKCTYPKLSMVGNRMRIEILLRECRKKCITKAIFNNKENDKDKDGGGIGIGRLDRMKVGRLVDIEFLPVLVASDLASVGGVNKGGGVVGLKKKKKKRKKVNEGVGAVGTETFAIKDSFADHWNLIKKRK